MIEEMLKNSKNSQTTEKINVHFFYNGSKYNIISEKDELFGSLFKRFQDTIGDLQLKAPVSGMISSRFGDRSGVRRSTHTGTDIAAPMGTAVTAAAEGTVASAGWNGSYGNCIIINHANGVQTWYAHLSKINVGVGQQVNTSTVIGNVGSTGNSTGPHLHLEVRINGTPVNPQNYLYK